MNCYKSNICIGLKSPAFYNLHALKLVDYLFDGVGTKQQRRAALVVFMETTRYVLVFSAACVNNQRSMDHGGTK